MNEILLVLFMAIIAAVYWELFMDLFDAICCFFVVIIGLFVLFVMGVLQTLALIAEWINASTTRRDWLVLILAALFLMLVLPKM